MASYEKYLICNIVLLAINCTSAVKNCASVPSDGYTIPRGDIILKYGEALNITCNLNEYMVDRYGENASSRLYFTRNNEIVNRAMVDVLNSTSIRLYIENHEKVKSANYYCWFWNESMDNFAIEQRDHEGRVVCFNVVFVGVPPQNITDFSCISRNYENLTCSWTAKTNYVYTSYNLTYRLKLRAARFLYDCPHLTEERINDDLLRMSCFWNVSTTPQYRQSHDTFYFRLRMNNTFGTNENNYTFEHYKRVLPNAPENLTAVATSPHSILLSWVIPLPMVNFQPGLQHRILYQCEYYEKVWQFGSLITDPNRRTVKSHAFNLTGLRYAHALCDIRVSMRSKLADPNDEFMWSENATTTVRTKSKEPDCPPKTNIGSFEIINNNLNRDVYVYWQQLREEQKNGENFTYIVEVENHPNLKPVDITRAYAKFKNLSMTNYVINIRSVNEIGPSAEKSTVVIPGKGLREPFNFVKREEKKDNNTYLFELSWEPPKESDAEITNYTIFWCSNQRERPYQCEGNLRWTTVPKDTMKYSQMIPGDLVYQFAISANSHSSSSGMTWAECTVISNQGMGKMNDVWINRVGSDFIEVGWKLECSNRIVGTINGFIIYYCVIGAPQQEYCQGKEQNVTIKGNVYTRSGIVTGLMPYTTYQLTVGFIINNQTYSKTSDPLRNTTKEAAPSPPQNINVVNVSNSTITVKWQPPLLINGHLKKYLISYNNQEKIAEPDELEKTLTDLMSFENYTITVKACTVFCSEPSPPKHVVTAMWLPGKIGKPEITFPNGSVILFSWEKPRPARGKVDYYQVDVIRKFSLENKTTPVENVTGRTYGIEDCVSGKYKAVYMAVRAVNIINGEHRAGPWSDVREWLCQPQYTPIIYILVGVSLIIFVVIMTCCFKRVYLCIRKMKNIDVELPPGLHQKVNTTESQKSMSKFGADEELLLNKLPGGIRSSADSSGCSSGHESITSSLESTTHISPSDSGTEQPRSPSLGEDRTHSLRQRNVTAGQRPPMNKGYVLPDAVPITNWPPKPSPVTGGSYCVLGVDPSCQTETDTPYVPITNVNTKMPFSCDMSQPPPYVVTGDFLKSTNPGYVPYAAAEPADKNTGYVVAGLTKDLVTPDLLQCDTPKPSVIEEKPLYVKAAEAIPNLKGVQFPWQQPPLETSLPKSGYVSVGDAPPPKTITDVTKGYVPHRQFEAKSLKED